MNLNMTSNDIIESLYTEDLDIDSIDKYRKILNLFNFNERVKGKGGKWYYESYWVKSYKDRYYNLNYYGSDRFMLHLNFKTADHGSVEEYKKYNKYSNEYTFNKNMDNEIYDATWFTDIENLDKLLLMLFNKELRSVKMKNIINEK